MAEAPDVFDLPPGPWSFEGELWWIHGSADLRRRTSMICRWFLGEISRPFSALRVAWIIYWYSSKDYRYRIDWQHPSVTAKEPPFPFNLTEPSDVILRSN